MARSVDYRCYHCGERFSRGPRDGGQAPDARLRCPRCAGPVHVDESTSSFEAYGRAIADAMPRQPRTPEGTPDGEAKEHAVPSTANTGAASESPAPPKREPRASAASPAAPGVRGAPDRS